MVIFCELAIIYFNHALEISKLKYHLIIPKKVYEISNKEYICSFQNYLFKMWQHYDGTFLALFPPYSICMLNKLEEEVKFEAEEEKQV